MVNKSSGSPSKAGTLASIIVAILLMCVFRVDWWWWGTSQPLVFGWLTWPMLYHLLIFAIGWLLVALTVIYLWPEPETPPRKRE